MPAIRGGTVLSMIGTLLAVSVGRAGTLLSGRRRVSTAFVKTQVDGRVAVSVAGVIGDEHVYEGHGGPDMALLAYPVEHYEYWRSIGLHLPEAAAMAENLTVAGLVETDVQIGDVFEVGTTRVQVTQPRRPCSKIAARYGRHDLAVLAQDTGFTGYLLRVLVPGEIGAGDEIRLVERADHGVTVAEAGRIVNVERNDLDGARRVLAVTALGSDVRRTLMARVESGERVGIDAARLFDTGPDGVGTSRVGHL
ncbi:MAG: hypothetical protein RI958_1303 [Actinomycetota bacterium]